MKIIQYEEIKLLKHSEKSTVLLVREIASERLFVKKTLRGYHAVYEVLKSYPNPYLPQIFEVTTESDSTIILEEYIEGQSLGSAELSQKQLHSAVKELCSILEFLHGIGIIHRDIKPSNIIFANDGHIRLIDFDAARMPNEIAEQDTRLLGTRGYAPPEQYGFAQTDARTDIYALGVTLKQLLGEKKGKYRYKKFIKRCTDLNPSKRYQSVGQAKKALSFPYNSIWYITAVLVTICVLCFATYNPLKTEDKNTLSDPVGLQTQTDVPIETLQPPNTEDEELKFQAEEENPADLTDITQEPLNTPDPSPEQQKPVQNQTETQANSAPEQTEPTDIDEEEPSPTIQADTRIILTDIISAPFHSLDSVPAHQIGAEWEIDDPPTNADATLYKDNQAIAKVRLFDDGKNDVKSRKIQLWSSPAIAASYIKVSEYLELDMSKDEVLAALKEAEKYPILPYPGMVLGKNEEDRISLLYEGYTISYYFRADMTLVEVKAYVPE